MKVFLWNLADEVYDCDDSLLVRTTDGFDRALLEGYLGLIPDAATLRIVFADGSEWAGADIIARISGTLTGIAPAA